MKAILRKLQGKDRRSIGRSEEVVKDVLADPSLFEPVFQGMLDEDPVIRMRCADAVEKITSKHPEYLRPYKNRLIRQVARVDQQEVRWHIAQMFSRLELTSRERQTVVEILTGYLGDQSRIVKTCSMQALGDMAEQDPALRSRIVPLLQELTQTGSAAMKARGSRLLAKLKPNYARAGR